jgi:hypothetical protein
MPIITAAAISAGAGLLGSRMAGKSAERAANTSAQAQLQAGREAASASAFRPIGLTTRFGSSNFAMGTDQYGNPIVTGAGYTPSGEITALQNRLSALYGDSLGQAEQAQALGAPMGAAGQRLFGLGEQYLAQSPEMARQQYIAEQQDLLRAPRMEEEQRLAASVFGRGRAGLNVGAAGQPELAALANARRQQDLALAANAEQAAQQRLGFGAGLFSTGGTLIGNQYALQNQALAPFLSQFGAQQGLEQAALQPLEIGANLGGRNVNTAGANALLQSGIGAANTRLQGSLVGPSLTANALSKVNYENLFNKLMSPTSGGWGSATNTNAMFGDTGQYVGQFTPQAATWESAFQPGVYG